MLSLTYSLSSGGATAQTNVTARQFAYVKNNSPSNTCALNYGTSRDYVYTVYTHPDGMAAAPNDGLSGTAVTETFAPSLTCQTITGNGSLNANAEFVDHISSGCPAATAASTSAPPTSREGS